MSTALSPELRDLYQELILDHGRTPHNKRKPHDANREALGHNPMCGDKIMVYLKLSPASQLIEDVAFEGQGCAISTASASMMTEIIKGKTAQEAQEIFDYFHTLCTTDGTRPPAHINADDLDRLDALSGVREFPIRVKCATLAWHAMQAAMNANSPLPEVSSDKDGAP